MRTRTLLAAAFAAAATLAALPARAQLVEAPARPADPALESFAGQVVLADLVAAVGGFTLGVETDQPAFLLAFGFAAPAVHLANGDGVGAVGSLLLHLGAPLLGAYLGYEIDAAGGCPNNGDYELCGLAGLAFGTLAGAATATIVDAALLSHAHNESLSPVASHGRVAAPTVALARDGGFMVGLSGHL
jgi:hypothetical protein